MDVTGETLFKVTGPNGEATNGGSGSWHLPKRGPGKWMPEIAEVVPCRSGYHLCRGDQLVGWLGPCVWVAEFHPGATVVDGGDKLVGSRARLVRATRWGDRSARLFAADCAERVLPIFERERPGDDRPRKAIEAGRLFAEGRFSRGELAAAGAAARAAARDAAGAAAGAAARAAARDAARDAARAAARDAARDAAGAAALAAAGAAEREWQITRLLAYLNGDV